MADRTTYSDSVIESIMSARSFSVASFWVLASAFGVQPAHADIYTWTDAKGSLNVSNLPPPEGGRVSHLVHEASRPVAPPSDSAREAARQAEVRALAQRVQQLEAEAATAKSAMPPDFAYPPPVAAPVYAPAPPPSVQYNVTLLPQTPQYDAGSAPGVPACDPTWAGCAPWWGVPFYSGPVVVLRAPNFHRFPPFRGAPPFRGGHAFHGGHAFQGGGHHVSNPPMTRKPAGVRKS
jgi:hypothetical protein